jgi:acyl-CoA thioesterase FadM
MIFGYETTASAEGANIRTWTGFKHFEYVVSEMMLRYLASSGTDVRQFVIDGGSFDIVSSRVSLTSVIELGDDLVVRVLDIARVAGARFCATVEIGNRRSGQTSLKGRYQLLLHAPNPESQQRLTGFLADGPERDIASSARPRPGTLWLDGEVSESGLPAAFAHEWIVPYYYCERSETLSYRGYVRAIETVVDEYLRSVGLAVPDLLADRAWIPVVAKYSIDLLTPVRMGSRVRTYFAVDEVVGDIVFNGSWATYYEQPGGWECTARGEIQHGYAISRGDASGSVATLDEATIKALVGGDVG